MAFWWVNQSRSFRQELHAEILWAPTHTKIGTRLAHWDTMTRVVPGDTIFSYASGFVVARSAASTSAIDARRPYSLPEGLWIDQGRLIRIRYQQLRRPIGLEDIPQSIRIEQPKAGPFQRDGRVKQGYLFPLADEFAELLLDSYPERFDSARELPPQADQGAIGLLRDLVGAELRTVSNRLNIITAIDPPNVVVATDRSPDGQPVPISMVEAALNQLRVTGGIVLDPAEVGYRSAFVGAVLCTLPGAHVINSVPPMIVLEPFASAAEAPLPTDNAAPFDGSLEVTRTTQTRGEQAEIRRRLFGNSLSAQCALCGKTYPVRFLVAAHIKRRSLCTEDEKRDIAHVAMPACVLGCDALFEMGFVTVDEQGRVRRTATRKEITDALADRLDLLDGRECLAFSEGRAPYFDWHRSSIFRTPD